MSDNKFVIVGLGEILWDLLPDGKLLGGAPANFAYHCKVLGADAHVISAVGNDELGNEILDKLNILEIPTSNIAIDKKHPTGTVSVKLDERGHPDFTIHQDVAWDYIPFSGETLSLALLANAVCYGSLAQRTGNSKETIINFLENTSTDTLNVFDINLRQEYYSKEIIENTLQLTDVFKLNDDELVVLEGMFSLSGSVREQLDKLLQTFDLKMVALTKGDKGSELLTAGEYSVYVSPGVKVADTVGAGDSFTAALVMGMLNDVPLKELHKRASDLAAFVCTQKGATPEVPENVLQNLNFN
ncbi:MAG: carbohydrate kinase [Bacteroidales bacterium]|nr:carbohydrate kinase [Bacteroidales bacterium]